MARLPALTPDELDVAQRALHRRITRGPRAQGPQHFDLRPDGSLTGPFNAFLLSPPVGTALQSLGRALRHETSLEARTREIAVLMVQHPVGSARQVRQMANSICLSRPSWPSMMTDRGGRRRPHVLARATWAGGQAGKCS